MTATLSVIVPTYNHARFLPLSLAAILAQSRQPDEVLVIDDASTDGTAEILASVAAKHPTVRVFRQEKNRGVLHNLWELLSIASGDYVVGCASDDIVLQGFFEKSMALLQSYPDAGLCSTLALRIREDGQEIGILPSPVVSRVPAFIPAERARKVLVTVGPWLQGNTVIYRRSALLDEGGFRAELGSFTDGFIAMVLALKYGCCFIPEPLAAWRMTSDSFARTESGDLRRFAIVIEEAVEMMETRYRDIFPVGFGRTWEREILFEIARRCVARRAQETQDDLAAIASIVGRVSRAERLRVQATRMELQVHTGILTALLLMDYAPSYVVRRRLRRIRGGAYDALWGRHK